MTSPVDAPVSAARKRDAPTRTAPTFATPIFAAPTYDAPIHALPVGHGADHRSRLRRRWTDDLAGRAMHPGEVAM
jgi:hypothetical protein